MSQPGWIGISLSGRYIIEEMLGQGGMSAVYKATDPNLKRVVAIKMIHPHLSNNADFVRRFEEEAAAVAQLRHPAIIQVYDFNRADAVYYMVLEFVPGETLQERLRRLNSAGERLAITEAIEYIVNICEAVDYAHQRGMIHRDIKPANIMLNLLGEAILMDFGIVKIVGGQQHTATGAVIGTAMYMSPEQIKGEHADRRTDIYSLGVTLFEMICGHPPFEADSAMTLMMMHINDPVPNLRDLNPEVPDDLVMVINKALAKNPNDRYQTAAQMAAALRNILSRPVSNPATEAPAPGATMLEELPKPMASPEAAFFEPPPAAPEGTVVESTPLPRMATSGSGGGISGTMVESSAVRPMPSLKASSTEARPKKFALSLPVIVGIFVGLACLLFGGLFLINQLLGGAASPATEQPVAVVSDNTETPIATTAPTLTPAATEITLPSVTPTLADTPTATVPPGIPFVRINAIIIDSENRYVVEYETFEFTEILPGVHIHFFFNTVSPENAGSPGSGPWFLYGGPRPFTGYRVSDRPAAATQMCSLVANGNHSVQPNSGNCVDLP